MEIDWAFAGYDVASGFKCSSIMKPRFARADGVRDNLKEQQFRFLERGISVRRCGNARVK